MLPDLVYRLTQDVRFPIALPKLNNEIRHLLAVPHPLDNHEIVASKTPGLEFGWFEICQWPDPIVSPNCCDKLLSSSSAVLIPHSFSITFKWSLKRFSILR